MPSATRDLIPPSPAACSRQARGPCRWRPPPRQQGVRARRGLARSRHESILRPTRAPPERRPRTASRRERRRGGGGGAVRGADGDSPFGSWLPRPAMTPGWSCCCVGAATTARSKSVCSRTARSCPGTGEWCEPRKHGSPTTGWGREQGRPAPASLRAVPRQGPPEDRSQQPKTAQQGPLPPRAGVSAAGANLSCSDLLCPDLVCLDPWAPSLSPGTAVQLLTVLRPARLRNADRATLECRSKERSPRAGSQQRGLLSQTG